MTVNEFIKYFEDFAPKGVAWEKDNVGLQVGSLNRKITNIFLTLELDEKGLQEAVKWNCNFIFTHHPLIFKPLKNINTDTDQKSKLVEQLIKNDITLYSAHTNFDFTKDGVSFELAKKLGLSKIKFLVNEESNQFKLVVFVPVNDVEKVSDAIFSAGGGVIGEYSKCSYRLDGTGTFEGSALTNPSIGEKQKFETVVETRLEVLVDKWKLKPVVSAMIKAHPYEEPAYDVYPLANKNVNFGFGAVGVLKRSMSKNEFLDHVCKSLKTKNVRYCNGKKNSIKHVAVCGGSGADLIEAAIGSGADAFVTADVKYHPFQDAENKILLVDAGHYETEIHSLQVVKRLAEKLIKEKQAKSKVYISTGSTNPVKFYNK